MLLGRPQRPRRGLDSSDAKGLVSCIDMTSGSVLIAFAGLVSGIFLISLKGPEENSSNTSHLRHP